MIFSLRNTHFRAGKVVSCRHHKYKQGIKNVHTNAILYWISVVASTIALNTFGYECTLCIAFQTFLMPIPQDDFRDELGCVKSIAVRRGRGCIAQSSELTVTASASTAEYVRRFGLFMCLLIPIPIPILRFSRVPDLLQIGLRHVAPQTNVFRCCFLREPFFAIYIYIYIYLMQKLCFFF